MTFAPFDPPHIDLRRNGALNPDKWRPARLNHADQTAATNRPQAGDLVGWRYGAWRVLESEPVPDTEIEDDERAKLDRYVAAHKPDARPQRYAQNRPWRFVLAHESGPMLAGDDFTQRLHDGTRTVHLRRAALYSGDNLAPLREPYMACSCHGHIWPCQEIDRNSLALADARALEMKLATAAPGTCASCLEPITTRQKTLTFPEESRIVPGAPGPTFHAGRAECWRDAEKYERSGRLADNPDVHRLASCPGIEFIHEGRRLAGPDRIDCSAGPACTGLHGPSGYRSPLTCFTMREIGGDGSHPQPTRDCGHRDCLGADSDRDNNWVSAAAADLIWRSRNG